MLGEDKCRVSFYGLDVQKMKNAPVTRSVYLLNKFGNGYKKIVDEIGDYLSCDADSFAGNSTVLVYPSGETGVFDYSGKTVWTGDLMYHGHPVQGVASDGNQIWCAVPEQNAIISYSIAHKSFICASAAKPPRHLTARFLLPNMITNCLSATWALAKSARWI